MATMLPEILQQDEVWVDATGRELLLDAMDRHHRANLIPFLRGNVCLLYGSHYDLPSAAFTNAEAEDWLEQTPLMRRLVELERGRPITDRALTAARNAIHEARTGYRKVRLG